MPFKRSFPFWESSKRAPLECDVPHNEPTSPPSEGYSSRSVTPHAATRLRSNVHPHRTHPSRRQTTFTPSQDRTTTTTTTTRTVYRDEVVDCDYDPGLNLADTLVDAIILDEIIDDGY